MTKVQTQLLVSPVTRDRADALALIRQEPRAEVYRVALEGGGLPALERQHAAELLELSAIAHKFNLATQTLISAMKEDGYTLDDVRGKESYPLKARATA